VDLAQEPPIVFMSSRRPCEAGYKCGRADSAVRWIRSGNALSMQQPQEVIMRSVWLARHCEDSAELALSIVMGLISCDMRFRDSSYHTVALWEGLAAAWRSWEVFPRLVMSASAASTLPRSSLHHLLPHHHHSTTTTTRQYTRRAEADLNIAADKLVMFLTASRYCGGHGSEVGLAEVKAFLRKTAITYRLAPSHTPYKTLTGIIIDTSTPSPPSLRSWCSAKSPPPPTWWQAWSRRTQRRQRLGNSTLASS
jgi:hypothetical protein